jgi:DAK2 domain fusion protein YloV
MSTKKLNGLLLKSLLESGANNLTNDYRRIDDLNVFPVPDGDTGTNMQLTINAGVKEILGEINDSIHEMSKKFSRGLLMGARGNSGVILSQLFRGLYVGFEEAKTVDAVGLVRGFRGGVEQAYKSVMNPVEGTILTVAREATEHCEKVIKATDSIETVFETYIKAAHKSLENTPNLLDKLREAGVVDSGGAGYVLIAEGMYRALIGKPVERMDLSSDYVSDSAAMHVEHDEFGYCTEFIIRTTSEEDVEAILRSQLPTLGDSIVVVQDDDLIKVHLHTLTPGDALNMAQRFGEFVTLKIENMQIQNENITHGTLTGAAPEVKKGPRKKYGVVAVAVGKGLTKMFKDFGVDVIVSGGQSMNPSTEDLVNAIRNVNADNVLVFPNNKNIILSAEQAVELITEQNVIVIPTSTLAEGYSALSIMDLTPEPSKIKAVIMDSIESVVSGELTFAIRDSEFQGLKIKENDWMGILNGKIVSSTPTPTESAKTLLEQILSQSTEIVTIITGEGTSDDEVDALQGWLEDQFPDVEIDVIEGGQPLYKYIFAIE